jgi:hypothetical protein
MSWQPAIGHGKPMTVSGNEPNCQSRGLAGDQVVNLVNATIIRMVVRILKMHRNG